MKAKTRLESSELVRISKKAVKVAKKNKIKTGVPIGKFFEEAAILKFTLDNQEIKTA